jgi:hypothetical protein
LYQIFKLKKLIKNCKNKKCTYDEVYAFYAILPRKEIIQEILDGFFLYDFALVLAPYSFAKLFYRRRCSNGEL